MNPASPNPTTTTAPTPRRWRFSSIAILVTAWAVLQLGGLFTPGLLDDVDSVYIQIAREMLQRHDFVTPTIDGIRFFDKPPLMYWMAAGSMRLFGIHDWAARLPLALGVLSLLLAVYALGIRFYGDRETMGAPHLASEMWASRNSADSTIPADRAGLYAALAMATCIGPYLYTRFYIPDILIALWMTLSVHLFLTALERINNQLSPSARDSAHSVHDVNSPLWQKSVPRGFSLGSHRVDEEKGALAPEVCSPEAKQQSALLPCLGFAAVTALNLLTKGFIGIVFPIGFVLLYLTFTRQLKLLTKLHLIPSTIVFFAIAAPWHILAALRNPPIPMPTGVGLPAHAGWAWFYLYNEHIARFLGRRIPHDYGQVPIPLFWLLLLLWLFPWVAFLPSALINAFRTLRADANADVSAAQDHGWDANVKSHDRGSAQDQISSTPQNSVQILTDLNSPLRQNPVARGFSLGSHTPANEEGAGSLRLQPEVSPEICTPQRPRSHENEAALACLLWAGIILGFFTLSSRQEYYHLPALPALALLVGGFLAAADAQLATASNKTLAVRARLRIDAAKQALNGSLYFLVPLGSLLFLLCGYLAIVAPTPHPGLTLNDVLSSNPALYNLSLGHVFDLTTSAMGFFRGPLLTVALCMLALGPISHLIRRSASPTKRARTFLANLLIAASMTGVLLAAHVALVSFYPILGSKNLALAINAQYHPGDLILIDGELTAGSTLLFYTPRTAAPILLVNGRINGPWFGSFYPDAPKTFLNDQQLAHLWASPHRIFLLTYHPTNRTTDLTPFAPVHTFATSGGKTILTNR